MAFYVPDNQCFKIITKEESFKNPPLKVCINKVCVVAYYASIAATPGNTLPSIASSNAPPPVEM